MAFANQPGAQGTPGYSGLPLRSGVSAARLAGQALLATLCLWLTGANAGAPIAPKAVRAVYAGYMNGMSIGTVTEVFEATAGTYTVLSETRPVGLAALVQRQPLRFTSKGDVTSDGLRPAYFESRRGAADAPQSVAEFDWTHSQLQLRHDAKTEWLPLNAGTQDRLSVMYQFMFMPLGKARHVDFWMTNGRKLDHYRYRVTPDVEIDTPLGRLKSTHLVKEREAGDTHTEVWISPRHRNLAVKLLIVERDGIRYEQVLQNVEIRD